jgi:nucleotide-binding universal stress UspA family protein
VDDAPVGRKVGDWAAALAHHFGAELTLLHVLSDTLLAHDWLWEEGARAESGCTRLGSSFRWVAPTHAWLRGLGPSEGRPPVTRTIVAVGAAGPVILKRARAARADLIVLGRNGAHATSSAEIGSATRLVLRGTQVPTFIVPSTAALEPHRGGADLGAA